MLGIVMPMLSVDVLNRSVRNNICQSSSRCSSIVDIINSAKLISTIDEHLLMI